MDVDEDQGKRAADMGNPQTNRKLGTVHRSQETTRKGGMVEPSTQVGDCPVGCRINPSMDVRWRTIAVLAACDRSVVQHRRNEGAV